MKSPYYTMHSFGPAVLEPVSTPTKEQPKEKIYLSTKLSDYFGVDYHNEGKVTIIHSSALDRASTDWDEAHQEIIDRGGELRLAGAGYGWWNIVS
jgi:hypothetical protein